jgi:hypothetical protein
MKRSSASIGAGFPHVSQLTIYGTLTGACHRHIWRNQLPPLGRRQQRAQSRFIVLRNTSSNRLTARGHEPSPINPAIQRIFLKHIGTGHSALHYGVKGIDGWDLSGR